MSEIRFTSEGGIVQEPRKPKVDKYATLRAAGKLAGTMAAARRLAAKRLLARPASPPAPGKYADMAAAGRTSRSIATVVPLGSFSELADAKASNPRLREWSLGEEAGLLLGSPWRFREIGSNSNWNKRSTFQRGIIVQSYATCTDFRAAVLHLAGEAHTIRAPRGWRWDIDANGLRLRSCSDSRIDYHPTASELTGDVAELPRLAKAGAAARKAANRAARADARAVKRAEEIGVMVCLADSIRAGNCRAGSESFARNHGLDVAKHYTTAELLAVANGQTRLVALACTAALRRAIKELDRGYSELSEHRVS
jgi:hypothetical protein